MKIIDGVKPACGKHQSIEFAGLKQEGGNLVRTWKLVDWSPEMIERNKREDALEREILSKRGK